MVDIFYVLKYELDCWVVMFDLFFVNFYVNIGKVFFRKNIFDVLFYKICFVYFCGVKYVNFFLDYCLMFFVFNNDWGNSVNKIILFDWLLIGNLFILVVINEVFGIFCLIRVCFIVFVLIVFSVLFFDVMFVWLLLLMINIFGVFLVFDNMVCKVNIFCVKFFR